MIAHRLVEVVVLVGLLIAVPAVPLRAAAPSLDRIDSWIIERLEARNIPGAAVAVVRDGETLHLRGYGTAGRDGTPVGVDTPFLIGSVSKPFTAHVIRRMVDEGLISLDDPARNHLPDIELPEGFEQVTTRHLLTHTAGLASHVGLPGTVTIDTSSEALNSRVAEVLDHPLRASPGLRYEYANAGYVLLAAIVEEVTGRQFHEVLNETLFGPMGMTDSFARIDHPAAARLATGHQKWFGKWRPADLPFDPAGVAYAYIGSSARDLAQFLHAHLDEDPSLVPVSAAALAEENVIPTGWDIPLETGQGLGWMIDEVHGHKVVSHAGSTPDYTAHLIMVPDAGGLGIAVLTNSSAFVAAGHTGQYEISLGLLDLMLGIEPVPAGSGLALGVVVPVLAWLVTAVLAGDLVRYLMLALPSRRFRSLFPGAGKGGETWPVLVALGYLGLGAGLLWFAPLAAARVFYPDVGWAATVMAYLALSCGAIRTIHAIAHRRQQMLNPNSSPQPTIGAHP